MRTAHRTIRTVTAAFILALATAVPANQLDLSLPSMGQPADQAMSPGEEERMGRDMMRQVRQRLPVLDDPVVNAYISDLGTRLASHARTSEDFEFFVIEHPRINAFAMPGGYIGLHTGLITAAETESELASVVAHEIAHVTERHIARQRLAGEKTGYRTMAMILAGILLATQSSNPDAGTAAMMGGMASGVQSQLNFSRAHEREADRVGLQALADAGFDPGGMARFFERLMDANRYRGDPPPFLSTHPLTSERVADARARAEELSVEDRFESPSFPYIRARLAARLGDDPAERVSAFQARVARDDATPAERYGLAVALMEAGQSGTAVERLRGLLGEQRNYAVLHATLAEAHLAAGDPEAALDVLAEGLSLYPGDYALQYRRIEALMAAGRGREALRAADTAHREHPDNLPLMALRARAADTAGDSAEAALATATYYEARGDIRGGLRQLRQVLDNPVADAYQRSRAEALQERWVRALESGRER